MSRKHKRKHRKSIYAQIPYPMELPEIKGPWVEATVLDDEDASGYDEPSSEQVIEALRAHAVLADEQLREIERLAANGWSCFISTDPYSKSPQQRSLKVTKSGYDGEALLDEARQMFGEGAVVKYYDSSQFTPYRDITLW